jgi:hypothetical protein
MECYVNARNLRNHGIGSLAELCRNIPVFQLTYGSFDGLLPLLDNLVNDWTTQTAPADGPGHESS